MATPFHEMGPNLAWGGLVAALVMAAFWAATWRPSQRTADVQDTLAGVDAAAARARSTPTPSGPSAHRQLQRAIQKKVEANALRELRALPPDAWARVLLASIDTFDVADANPTGEFSELAQRAVINTSSPAHRPPKISALSAVFEALSAKLGEAYGQFERGGPRRKATVAAPARRQDFWAVKFGGAELIWKAAKQMAGEGRQQNVRDSPDLILSHEQPLLRFLLSVFGDHAQMAGFYNRTPGTATVSLPGITINHARWVAEIAKHYHGDSAMQHIGRQLEIAAGPAFVDAFAELGLVAVFAERPWENMRRDFFASIGKLLRFDRNPMPPHAAIDSRRIALAGPVPGALHFVSNEGTGAFVTYVSPKVTQGREAMTAYSQHPDRLNQTGITKVPTCDLFDASPCPGTSRVGKTRECCRVVMKNMANHPRTSGLSAVAFGALSNRGDGSEDLHLFTKYWEERMLAIAEPFSISIEGKDYKMEEDHFGFVSDGAGVVYFLGLSSAGEDWPIYFSAAHKKVYRVFAAGSYTFVCPITYFNRDADTERFAGCGGMFFSEMFDEDGSPLPCVTGKDGIGIKTTPIGAGRIDARAVKIGEFHGEQPCPASFSSAHLQLTHTLLALVSRVIALLCIGEPGGCTAGILQIAYSCLTCDMCLSRESNTGQEHDAGFALDGR